MIHNAISLKSISMLRDENLKDYDLFFVSQWPVEQKHLKIDKVLFLIGNLSFFFGRKKVFKKNLLSFAIYREPAFGSYSRGISDFLAFISCFKPYSTQKEEKNYKFIQLLNSIVQFFLNFYRIFRTFFSHSNSVKKTNIDFFKLNM